MFAGFPRRRWPQLRFSESCAVRISVKISRICEFRVIMGIMTGLLGCCSSSTLGSRANEYLRSGFDCIIRPVPSGAGRTTPSQPGHYPLTHFTKNHGILTNANTDSKTSTQVFNSFLAVSLSIIYIWWELSQPTQQVKWMTFLIIVQKIILTSYAF